MINCELSYFSNSVLFAFNDFPVREIERRRLAKKEITLVVTQRNSLVGTNANPLVGFRKIPFLGTVEKPLIRTVVKMIQNGFKSERMEQATFPLQKGYSITLTTGGPDVVCDLHT